MGRISGSLDVSDMLTFIIHMESILSIDHLPPVFLAKCPFLFFGMAFYVSVVVAASSAISQGHDRCKYGVLNAMNDHRGVVKCAQYGDSYLVLKDVPIGREGWRGAMT